jgi:hypothetical protein
MAYRAIDHDVYEGVLNFLRNRYKASSRGTFRFSNAVVFGDLGVLQRHGSNRGGAREPLVKSVGKPDARNGHIRFDERGRETGLLPNRWSRPEQRHGPHLLRRGIRQIPGVLTPQRAPNMRSEHKRLLTNGNLQRRHTERDPYNIGC